MSTQRTWAEILADDPDHSRRYARRWDEFARTGRDILGEARLVDAMAPRGARILDAGCGQGRIGGHLADLGHEVVGVDIDPYLVGVARNRHPGARWLIGDLAELPAVLAGAGVPGGFDLLLAAGNVLTFIDAADRHRVLAGFREALGPGGRAVLGFGAGRGWGFAEFAADARAAGLVPRQRFASWDLRPFEPDSGFLVAELVPAAGEPGAAGEAGGAAGGDVFAEGSW